MYKLTLRYYDKNMKFLGHETSGKPWGTITKRIEEAVFATYSAELWDSTLKKIIKNNPNIFYIKFGRVLKYKLNPHKLNLGVKEFIKV